MLFRMVAHSLAWVIFHDAVQNGGSLSGLLVISLDAVQNGDSHSRLLCYLP